MNWGLPKMTSLLDHLSRATKNWLIEGGDEETGEDVFVLLVVMMMMNWIVGSFWGLFNRPIRSGVVKNTPLCPSLILPERNYRCAYNMLIDVSYVWEYKSLVTCGVSLYIIHAGTPNEVHLLPETVVSEEAPRGEFTYGRPAYCRADCICNYSAIYSVKFWWATTHNPPTNKD